jgi:hypothetical protein
MNEVPNQPMRQFRYKKANFRQKQRLKQKEFNKACQKSQGKSSADVSQVYQTPEYIEEEYESVRRINVVSESPEGQYNNSRQRSQVRDERCGIGRLGFDNRSLLRNWNVLSVVPRAVRENTVFSVLMQNTRECKRYALKIELGVELRRIERRLGSCVRRCLFKDPKSAGGRLGQFKSIQPQHASGEGAAIRTTPRGQMNEYGEFW